jgi:hypothetical protein
MRQQFKDEFNKLTANEQKEVIALAERQLKWDSFFIQMAEQDGIERAMDSATERAVVLFMRGKIHNKFGDRQND